MRPPTGPVEVDVFDANIEKAMRVIGNTLGVRRRIGEIAPLEQPVASQALTMLLA